jgi:uncharacterized phage protein gp47/JayE
MAYFAPYVDASGLHIPTFNDIKSYLVEGAVGIFGSDIYLENDSQDYEFISIFAYCLNDCFLTAQVLYNNRGPLTASGGGLDGVVKLNGIKRKPETVSQCMVTVIGDPRTTIINSMIADDENVNWRLPTSVYIPAEGRVDVEATCTIFDHDAPAGTLTKIVTPTDGWTRVENAADSVPGQTFETDIALRARQSISTARPSRTVLEGTIGAVAEVSGVSRYRIYENDTNQTDENTLPPHSIAVVAEGGDDYEIAYAMYLHKTPGCYTYGDTLVEIITQDDLGMPDTLPIRFFRPDYKDIYATVYVKRLPGYVASITDNIVTDLTNYLNEIRIGDDLTISALWAVAQQAMPEMTAPIYSITKITAGESADTQTEDDIVISFREVTRTTADKIQIVLA